MTMKSYAICFLLLLCINFTVYGQKPDTVSYKIFSIDPEPIAIYNRLFFPPYGNIVINSDPVEVEVEIPGLNIKCPKTDKALIIEYIPPAKYQIRVTARDKILKYKIQVKKGVENHLFFDLEKKTVTNTEFLIKKIRVDTLKKILSAKDIPADTSTVSYETDEIFTVVEEQPRFPGGEEARLIFLSNNIHYPDSAVKNDIRGTVFVTFVVEKEGSLSNIKVLKGIGSGCDEEVVRVVKMMPKWIPGRQRGSPVRVNFNLPIKFILENRVY